jgi:hypothetical protein
MDANLERIGAVKTPPDWREISHTARCLRGERIQPVTRLTAQEVNSTPLRGIVEASSFVGGRMNAFLFGTIIVLGVLVIALIWVWVFPSSKSAKYLSYRDLSSERHRRDRAWDAAVARARNRYH